MRKLCERLFKIAPCLVAAVVVMPTMADDTAFAVDQERLWLRLVLPDAAGAFPTNASPYWEKVSRVEFTNILERISKMTRLKSLSLDVRAESKVPLDLSFLSFQTNMTELSLGGNLHICSFRKIVHLPLERLDGCYYSDSSVSLADDDSLGLLKSLKFLRTWKDFRAIEKLPSGLVSLDMSHSPEGDYCGCFTNLVNLEELEMDTIFRKDQYIDEDDIRAMKKLKRLVLNGGYELGDLGALRECKSLENLEIAFCESRPLDLSVLNGLPLKELKLNSCLVHEVKGLEKCPLKKISIDFCPIASFDDFGVFPDARIVELRRTGIRSADRNAVLRHFPSIWSLLYGDLIEGFCDGDRCNEVVCFGPTNIVFAAGGDKAKGLSFMGFDMDSSIVYDDEVFSISEVIGMSNCVSDKRYESVIGLGRPFHGFTTVKLIGCGEVERIGDETYDGPVDSLEFLREDDGVVFDFPSEKKWAMEIAAEMERVYGATFCWDDNDETATFLVVKGKSDAFDFAIASCAGSSETHCGTGDEVSITRREYRSRQFYVSRRLREFRPSFKDIEATNPDHRRQFRIYSVKAADVEGCKNRNVVWRHDILVKGAEFPLDDSLSISIYAKGRDAKKGEVQSEPCILSRSDTELRLAWPEEYAGEEFSQGRMDIVLSNVVDPTDIPDGIKHREIRAFISKPE